MTRARDTEAERLLDENERAQDALLDLKNTISRMIGEGTLPNGGETLQWVRGIDLELERERSERRALLNLRASTDGAARTEGETL